MRRNVSLSLTQLAPAAALLGALLLAPAHAFAQDDVTLTMARERFKEGVGYFDKKDFAKARVAFLQAYALKKHPAVLLNLAQSELRSGHEADAAKHFAQYLREHKDATEAERQGADTGLTAAKALVAEVALDVDTSGAEIYVDGDLEGQAPLPGPVYLTPGAHQLQARKDGKTASSDVNAIAGQATSLRLSLARTAKPAAAAAPGAGTEGETTPPEGGSESAPEEPHSSRQGFFPWLTHTPGAMIGVGLTGAGLIGGGAFAFSSKSSYDAADSVAGQISDEAIKDGKVDQNGKASSSGACTNPDAWLPATTPRRTDRVKQYQSSCDKYSSNVKSGDTFKTLAIVSFAVAGAAAVGTIIYYIADSKKTDSAAMSARKRRLMVLPVYQPGFAGGLISGTF